MSNQHQEGPHAAARRKLEELKLQALIAAKRGDWTRNHKLCDEHDRLALELLRGKTA